MQVEKICPVCNGLTELAMCCPDCGETMYDRGALAGFLGPYSPYQDVELVALTSPEAVTEERCVHLISCPRCGLDKRLVVNLV